MAPILSLFNFQGGPQPVIVGVRVYNVLQYDSTLQQSVFPVTRLTIANDPNNYVNINNTSSIFNSISPWKDMEEYNILSNGNTYKKGTDAQFSRDNDTYVYIPKFYYNVVQNENYLYYYISNVSITDFELHPGSGRYISKYTLDSSNISKTGVYPHIYAYYPISGVSGSGYNQSTTTPSNWAFPAIANKSVSNGYFAPVDIATLCALRLLFLIETAGFNWMMNSTALAPLENRNAGTDAYGNTLSDLKLQVLTATGNTKYKTGSTDSITGHTGYKMQWTEDNGHWQDPNTGQWTLPAGTRYFYTYKYRNIENFPYGGFLLSLVFPISGIFEAGNNIYINTASNPLQYTYSSSNYTTLTHNSFTGQANKFGFNVTKLKYFSNKKWLFYPQTVSADMEVTSQNTINGVTYISGYSGHSNQYVSIYRDKREDSSRQSVYIGSDGIGPYPNWPSLFSYITGEYTHGYPNGTVVGNMGILKRAIYVPPAT